MSDIPADKSCTTCGQEYEVDILLDQAEAQLAEAQAELVRLRAERDEIGQVPGAWMAVVKVLQGLPSDEARRRVLRASALIVGLGEILS